MPNRIVRIDTDFNKDGSIELTSTIDYDADGRISKRTNDYSPELQVSDTVTEYFYSADQLVEKKIGNNIEMFTYADNLLVEYSDSGNLSGNQRSFRYDDSGQLIGTSGRNIVYSADDCYDDFAGSFDPVTAEPDLVLNYTNSLLGSITSADGVFLQEYAYNANNKLISITSSYTCPGINEILKEMVEFTYDSNDLASTITLTTRDDIEVTSITRNDAGKPVKIEKTTSSIEFNDILSIDIDTITYNEQGLPASLETSKQPPSQFSPDVIATFSYESQTCRVAVTANPLQKAILAASLSRLDNNDPAICLYPLDVLGF